MKHAHLAALAGALAASTLACTTTAEVPWDVRVADPALAQSAATIETTIRRGGCEGVLVYHAAIGRDRRGPPPTLGRGLHGFAAEARDAECRTIARACIERDLPLPPGARVEVVLEATVPEPACAPSSCSAGTCAADDASIDPMTDAQIDPMTDAQIDPMTDAGIDPITDSGIDPITDSGVEPDSGTPDPVDAGVPEPIDAGSTPCSGATFGEHCYEFHAEAREQSAAEAVCASWGGHLTSLGGPEEEAFVRGLAGSSAYYVGLNDLAVEGIWQWVDGSTSSHRDWAGGSPTNRDQNDCVIDQPSSGWSVVRCRETHAFVCER